MAKLRSFHEIRASEFDSRRKSDVSATRILDKHQASVERSLWYGKNKHHALFDRFRLVLSTR
jgi:hypothetical protein